MRSMRCAALAAFVACALVAAAVPDSAQRKIALIRHHGFPAGSTVTIGQGELNLYVRHQIARSFRQGVRDPRIELGYNRVTASAYIDFPALRKAMGKPLGWFMKTLLAGERRVQVDAHLHSSGGKAEVKLDRVQVSGVSISGTALDYLVRNFVLPYYPNAAIGRPFPLEHNVERLELRPTEVAVVIRK
jgi:hypothetical protein